MERKVAIITGANRGLGLGVAQALYSQGFDLVLIGRDSKAYEPLIAQFNLKSPRAKFFEMDLSKNESQKEFESWLKLNYKSWHLLINNAGVLLDGKVSDAEEAHSDKISLKVFRETYEVNVLAPFRLMQIVVPKMKEQNYGRIVNVSSGMGALNNMSGGWPAYRSSKAALNALTRIVASETENWNIKVNSVSPGWVQTDMGGKNATRTVEEGIQGILWAATLDDEGPTGGFFRDGKPLEW